MITLTEKAAKRINEIAGDQVMLFGVLGGGCAGFEYDVKLVDEDKVGSADKFTSEGIDFYVDNESIMYLLGSIIDFKQDILSSHFVFKNPLATMSCGCGTSFSV